MHLKIRYLYFLKIFFRFYSPEHNWRVHVINTNPNKSADEFNDLSQVEKYNMSEEEYNKKEDSVRAFMMKNKV